MPKQLAFMTFGELLASFGDPAVQSFVDRIPGVYAHAEAMPGYLGEKKGRPLAAPQCWGGVVTDRHIATLTLWEDLESVAAFAYHGNHGEALKRRKDWVVDRGLPEHVAWWVDSDGELSYEAAMERMDMLFKRGPTPTAFSLRSPFDADGNACRIDNQKVKAKTTLLA